MTCSFQIGDKPLLETLSLFAQQCKKGATQTEGGVSFWNVCLQASQDISKLQLTCADGSQADKCLVEAHDKSVVALSHSQGGHPLRRIPI